MPVIKQLACALGRRDEVPNQELARQLAEAEDRQGSQVKQIEKVIRQAGGQK